MADDEGEPPAGLEDSADRPDRRLEVTDVHEPELTGDAVEALVLQRCEGLGVVLQVGDVAAPCGVVATGELQHLAGAIDTDNLRGAGMGERSRRQALAARHVQHRGPPQGWHEPEETLDGGLVRAAPGTQQTVVPASDVGPRRSRGSGAHGGQSCSPAGQRMLAPLGMWLGRAPAPDL